MKKTTRKPGERKEPESREERLKAALRANLRRRKVQAKAREKTDKG